MCLQRQGQRKPKPTAYAAPRPSSAPLASLASLLTQAWIRAVPWGTVTSLPSTVRVMSARRTAEVERRREPVCVSVCECECLRGRRSGEIMSCQSCRWHCRGQESGTAGSGGREAGAATGRDKRFGVGEQVGSRQPVKGECASVGTRNEECMSGRSRSSICWALPLARHGAGADADEPIAVAEGPPSPSSVVSSSRLVSRRPSSPPSTPLGHDRCRRRFPRLRLQKAQRKENDIHPARGAQASERPREAWRGRE
jgi:hypothetical protein